MKEVSTMRKERMVMCVWVLMMALGLLAGSIGDPGAAAARNIAVGVNSENPPLGVRQGRENDRL